MKILQISFRDHGGGAEQIALNLHQVYRHLGHEAKLLVGYRHSSIPNVHEIDPFPRNLCGAFFRWFDRELLAFPWYRNKIENRKALRLLSNPKRIVSRFKGIEDFHYPTIDQILQDLNWIPDLIHLHNLHGDYFNLNQLGPISKRFPCLWTLHDTWGFTGHCGYYLSCDRWKASCGLCPDLKRYPEIHSDSTAFNLRKKKEIYQDSRLQLVTPSQWLKNSVSQSILRDQPCETIPNGVNSSVFYPSDDRTEAKKQLGIPPQAFLCLFVSQAGAKAHPYKDYPTIERAVQQLHLNHPDMHFICLGGASPAVSSKLRFHFPGMVRDPNRVALYYQAADVLLHAAHADNFPNVILEAQACATPAIATNVGGIGEQIEHGKTGFLIEPGSSVQMIENVSILKSNPPLLDDFRKNCLRLARQFQLIDQAKKYLQLAEKIRN